MIKNPTLGDNSHGLLTGSINAQVIFIYLEPPTKTPSYHLEIATLDYHSLSVNAAYRRHKIRFAYRLKRREHWIA